MHQTHKTQKMTKAQLIQEIAMAINAQADRTASTPNATKRYDADMFFSLAFRTVKELKAIANVIGI